MTPIMCCGETAEEKAQKTEEKVKTQIESGLSGLKGEVVGEIVVAYEPIWAIGTGLTVHQKTLNLFAV